MNYHLLSPGEFDRLKFIFEPHHLPIPNPEIERVAVAEDEGKIVSMSILRLLPIWDALWAAPLYRGGRVDYRQLEAIATEPLKLIPGSRCYAIVDGKHTEKAATNAGYKIVSGRLFEKEF